MKILRANGEVVEMSFEEKEGKEAFWHSSAHILAQAVKRLYPNAKCAIGPAIEKGFYYDFEFDFPFSEEYLGDIEEEMPWSVYKDILVFRDRGSHNNLSIECIVEMYIWLMNYNGARLTKINAPFENIDRTIGYGCFEF